jgi:hypothetical protein
MKCGFPAPSQRAKSNETHSSEGMRFIIAKNYIMDVVVTNSATHIIAVKVQNR